MRQLAELWGETDLIAALRRGADLLAAAAGGVPSALFLLTDDGIAAEAWASDESARDLERRARFQRAALEGPHADPRHFGPSGAAVTRRTVPSAGNARATLAWVCGARAGAEDHASGRTGGEAPQAGIAASILDILVARAASLRDADYHRARQEQYERWFKTLDAQLRILDRERQKFAAVANQSDTCAFVTDASHAVTWHNKAMAQLFGNESDQGWTGRPCVDLCGRLGLTEPGTCAGCPVRRAFESNAAVHREVHAPDGRELYLTALPIKGPDGRAFEVLGQIQDLTNLEVVRRAKDRIQTVISGAPIVLFAVDRDGVFTLSEGKGLEAMGLLPGEVVGKSAFDLYRDTPSIEACIHRALAGETVTDSVELGPLAYDAYYVPLRNAEGAILGVIGVATDITERRRAERALQESEEKLRHAQRLEAVGSLAGGVAHDFNNLLTAMFGHLKFLRDRAGSSGEMCLEIDAVEHAANRAATLTRQLLAFSRKQVLQLRAVDLNQIVREMEPMLKRLIGEDVTMVAQLGAERPWIRADAGQVEQVVINLVVNARDAMPSGGRLALRTLDVASGALPGALPGVSRDGVPEAGRLEASRSGSFVGLVVSDTGCGMDAATLERAFEPFFTTKAVGEGTGLGLSTVYGIVKQSEGEVFVTSAPGEGTTFTLYFPSASEPASEAPRPGAIPALVPGHETILLVEDEPMVRDLFRDVLEAAGYRVLEAANGIEALQASAAFEGAIDLLVTDVVMPGMAGGELVRRMAEVRPGTKVLYVSGYTDDALVRRGVIEAGVSFLHKPCMPDELSMVVRQILG
ncbi:MAG TPA: PAS domain-containing protein [Candidatus Eisenbacteria bacterium]|nr:PAS domain-containing protein [Candidatus Eisenbacteria bacterium]